MNKQKTLYAITTEDIINTSAQENIPFAEKDLLFIKDKIGDYFGDKWQDAIRHALNELEKNKKSI